MKTYYMNRETGELLTFSEMMKQFVEEYDGADGTNALYPDECYEMMRI